MRNVCLGPAELLSLMLTLTNKSQQSAFGGASDGLFHCAKLWCDESTWTHALVVLRINRLVRHVKGCTRVICC